MSLLPTLELATNHNPTASVIWLHGLGADGYDFVPVVKELQIPDALSLRFVFPHAPLQPVTVNNGMVMRAWYDVSYDGLERRTDDAGVLRSAAAVEALVAHEIARGIPARRIVLAGFSQGGAVALTLGTRFGKRLGGIMALSTYLPMPDELPQAASPENRDIPIFMAHGLQDNVIPLRMAETSRSRLAALDYPVEWHTYPMAHSLCMEEVEAMAAWLRQHLEP
ncbi:MAG: alpha/beta fold hydrolase [Betaproteobacteria bacterium]|nr:alpha/beta fold hydrolase [Betaproteobacteria bacterium]